MKAWLLLIYKIPREPTAGRVFVWRKLKQLGAIAVQDAAWVLPQTSRTLEQLQWLVAEIKELSGDAVLWEAEQISAIDAEALRQQFQEQVESEYREILAALKRSDRDLSGLSKRFQAALARDFFATDLGKRTRQALLTANDEEAP